MENNNKDSAGANSCQACEGHHHGFHKFVVLRWILGIVILTIVFCVGVKVGEFKSSIENQFGDSGRSGHGMMYNRGYYPNNMMYFSQPASTTDTTTPPASTKK